MKSIIFYLSRIGRVCISVSIKGYILQDFGMWWAMFEIYPALQAKVKQKYKAKMGSADDAGRRSKMLPQPFHGAF